MIDSILTRSLSDYSISLAVSFQTSLPKLLTTTSGDKNTAGVISVTKIDRFWLIRNKEICFSSFYFLS